MWRTLCINVNVLIQFIGWLIYFIQFSPAIIHTIVQADMAPVSWREHWFDHSQNLSVMYIDEHVAVYYDSDVNKSINWPFLPLSNAWKYVKNTYGSFGADPHLYVIIHSRKHKGCHFSSFLWDSHDFRNVIDCGQLDVEAWNKNTSSNVEMFMSFIGFIIQDTAKQTDHYPAQDVSKWTMHEIIYYDIYFHLWGGSGDTANLLKKRLGILLNFPFTNTYWFRDWFFPIYTKYGGTSVLNNFLDHVAHWWPRNRTSRMQYSYTKQMSMGEFVHFWSNAAGTDLQPLARAAFSWTMEYIQQLKQAKKDYPIGNYSDPDCEESDKGCKQPSIIRSESDGQLAVKIGVGLGVTLFILCIVFGITFATYRRRIRKMKCVIRELTVEEVEEFHRGSNTYEKPSDVPIHLFPFDSRFEIPQKELNVVKQKIIGSGEYGQVFLGYIKRESAGEQESLQVAVKTVKPNVDVNYFKAMLSEIKIMAYLGQHENIVSLLATVTSNIKMCEVFVAIEFCSKGDLLQFLRKNNANFKDLYNDCIEPAPNDAATCVYENAKDKKDPKVEFGSYLILEEPDYSEIKPLPLSTLNLLDLSIQIANGMAFLSSKNVIHGDLAARNVLLTSENGAKISDFGLSRQILKYSNYTKKSLVPLPWRWMAIESLNEAIFSVHSDVWAFGVTLWEIFTLGKVPYPGAHWNHDFIKGLERGDRLPQPNFANSEIYDLLRMFCWKKLPDGRLDFNQLRINLENIKAKLESEIGVHGGITASCFEME